MDCSLPGSSIHGIFLARVLEWGAIAFSPYQLGPDKTWPTGEGNGNPLQYSCLENPMNNMERQKVMTLKDELPRLVGVQYTTGVEWRNSHRKNEEAEPKWK